jgi:microcin C transport system permease protein
MLTYAVRRLFLMIPTLFGILLVNFMIIQAAPGGPVEQMIAKLRGTAVEATARISGAEGDGFQGNSMIDHGASSNFESKYRGARGLDPEFIAKLEKMYGFDQPAYIRFGKMIKNYLTFNFGDSYFRDISVAKLIAEKLPVSISLGLWSTLLIYCISIPLGIQGGHGWRALRHLDKLGHHCGIRDPQFPLCYFSDCFSGGGQLFANLSLARACFR